MHFQDEQPPIIKSPCATKWQQKWLRLDVYHPDIQNLATAAEKFCGRWYRNEPPKLLVLAGGTGVGKTHVACAIYNFACSMSFKAWESGNWYPEKIPSTTLARWPEVVNEIRAEKLTRLPQMYADDLVIIDDIGAEQDPFKQGVDKLCQVLSRRQGAFTVITTNVQPEAWPTRFDLRIADRLMRDSIVVTLFGIPSYALL